ncbi:hypothetical protein ARMA_2782 [Ardenticatena maritima]|uniref:Uncharacterized protein n=1 Tax=Ardenticatena maritima TaxID=872965 RepID=A0A0M8KBJ1_9CHLR|nr:hypothetical protein ARMA_2782 [Ardenticatena maritima]
MLVGWAQTITYSLAFDEHFANVLDLSIFTVSNLATAAAQGSRRFACWSVLSGVKTNDGTGITVYISRLCQPSASNA